MLPGFSCKDLLAVLIYYNEDGVGGRLVFCTAYLPYDCQDPPPKKELEELVRYCEGGNLHLVMVCDSNAYDILSGISNSNDRWWPW